MISATAGLRPAAEGPIKGAGVPRRFPASTRQNATTGSFTLKVFGEPPATSPLAAADSP